MAFVIKILGSGNLTGGSTNTMYEVPANTSAIISSIRLVNQGSSTTYVNLFVLPSAGGVGSPYRIEKPAYSLAVGAKLVEEDIVTLGAGDKLQVQFSSSPNPTYSYMVNGTERT